MSADSIAVVSRQPALRRAWYRQLWVQVLVAMAVGVVVGHFYPEAGQRMQPLGDGFIKLIRMLIAPIVFCTVVLGIAKMGDMSKVGKVAIKARIYFELMTTVALAIAMVIVNLWQPGAGMNVNTAALDAGSVKTYIDQTKSHGVASFLLDIIPSAMVGAFAEGNVLQVLLISVILGSTLVALGPRARAVTELLEIGSEMLFRAVAIVMWVAPIGAFGAIAFTVGRYGAGALASLGNTPLDIYQQLLLLGVLLLTSKGAAGVAGAAFVVLAATLSTVGSIPVASVALILGVHRLLAEGLVPTNLIGNAVATIVISKWEGALDKSRLDSVLASPSTRSIDTLDVSV